MPTTTGFPDASTAGIVAGTVLTDSGDVTVGSPDTVIENLNISGKLRINANNTTVRNCKATSDDINVILIAVGVTGTLIHNCDIDGLSAGGQGIAGTGTFKNNNIHNCADGIDVRGDNVLIAENYIHAMAGSVDSHLDCIQADGGFANLTIKNNTAINEQDQTSAIQLDNYWGPISNTTITGNLLCGGDYPVYIQEIAVGQNPGGPVTGTVFSDNHLGTGTFGFLNQSMQLGGVVTSSGNVDDGDTIKGNLQTTGQPAAAFMISRESIGAALAGITATFGEKTQGYADAADLLGNLDLAQRQREELTILLQRIKAEMTAAGDSSSAMTVDTQVTALA